MAQDYGAVQPIADVFNKYLGWAANSKPVGSKPQQMNWKPEPNEEQKKQIAAEYAPQTVGKKRTGKPSVRTGPLANKRVPRKKSQ